VLTVHQGVRSGLIAQVAILAVLALAMVAALLAESFGREVWWLRTSRRTGFDGDVEPRAVGAVHG
jgi:hypothetical protein